MKTTKRKVKKIAIFLKDLLFNNWDFDYYFYEELDQELPLTLIMINPQWEYRQASMHFYLPALKSIPEDRLFDKVLHEFVHCLIAPITDDDSAKLIEMVTQDITIAIKRLINNHEKIKKLNEGK